MMNLDSIHTERQSIYGPWQPNMIGTSEQLTGLARQWQNCNPQDKAFPGWWTPLTQCAVKLNRIASGRYHEDNFSDLRVYLKFVEEMQKGVKCEAPQTPKPKAPDPYYNYNAYRPAVHAPVLGSNVERIYVAGPYSADSKDAIAKHVHAAATAAVEIMQRGHDAHCPHAATWLPDRISGSTLGYERWMRLDMGIIEKWATAIFVLDFSPGTCREIDFALERGIKVYWRMDDIPDLRKRPLAKDPLK